MYMFENLVHILDFQSEATTEKNIDQHWGT